MKDIINPIIAENISGMIKGKKSFTNKEYQETLKTLWGEFELIVKENKEICKKRDKIVEKLNDW